MVIRQRDVITVDLAAVTGTMARLAG